MSSFVPARVLVLEGSLNSALSVIRSLGRMGTHITVGDYSRFSPGALSRYAARSITYPNPQDNIELFLDFLLEHVRTNEYDLVLPMSDFTVLPLAERRADFEQFTIVAASPTELLRIAHDKQETFRRAQECGVAIPRTYVPQETAEIVCMAGEIEYPAVVKPRSKVCWNRGMPVVTKVTADNFVSNPRELVATYLRIHSVNPFPIIQEKIDGGGFGFFAMMAKGTPVAVAGHRRIREYPLSGGMSTYRESYLDDELERAGRRLLEHLSWDGIAMVEFKRDRKDDTYKLMEINARWWGSLPLAVAAGVDFPWLYTRYLLDGKLDQVPNTFRQGVRCRALFPWDFLWLAARMRQPGRIRSLRDFVRFDGQHFDVLSASDPLPVLGMCGRTLGYASDILSGRLRLTGERGGRGTS